MRWSVLAVFIFVCQLSFVLCLSKKHIQKTRRKKTWTILVYIQSDADIKRFAEKNIYDMQEGFLSDEHINLLVHWNKPEENRVCRYLILPDMLAPQFVCGKPDTHHQETDLIRAAQWALSEFPAEQFGLILWNHGTGINDYKPSLPRHIQSWLELPGLSFEKQTSKSIQRVEKSSESKDGKGVLYDAAHESCLSAKGLLRALRAVAKLHGKKIDLLGMDACLMAMLEVCYQVKDCARYFVGSQQIEPGSGWNYKDLLRQLTRASVVTADSFAASILSTYKKLYRYDPEAQDYTLSAVDLGSIEQLTQNLEELTRLIFEIGKYDESLALKLVEKARAVCIEFYAPEYIDLFSFYAGILYQLQKSTPRSAKYLSHTGRPFDGDFSEALKQDVFQLRKTALEGVALFKKVIKYRVSGPAMANVKGLSIYYPKKRFVHSSYKNALFAQQSSWSSFLSHF